MEVMVAVMAWEAAREMLAARWVHQGKEVGLVIVQGGMGGLVV